MRGSSRLHGSGLAAMLVTLGAERLLSAFWLNSWLAVSAPLVAGSAFVLASVLVSAPRRRRIGWRFHGRRGSEAR